MHNYRSIFFLVLWSNPINALAKSLGLILFNVFWRMETISCQNAPVLLPTFQGFRPSTKSHPEISIDWRRPAQSERAQFRCQSSIAEFEWVSWWHDKSLRWLGEREASWIVVIVILVNVGDLCQKNVDTKTLRLHQTPSDSNMLKKGQNWASL